MNAIVQPDPVQFQNAAQRLALRTMCEEKQLMFTRYMFKARENRLFISNWHHEAIARAFDMVLEGKISRLLINLPPGFTKTMFMLDFLARTFGLDPLSKSILVTYNSGLANENSGILMDTMRMPEYRAMWPVRLRQDKQGIGRWQTLHGGGLLASGVGGSITGFRAGRMTPGVYSGGMFIDDPLKPDDANSKTMRNRVNRALNETLRSRLMLPETPMVMVQQRLHDNDPSGFVLRGGTGEEWHHLNLPAKMEPQHLKPGKSYARRYPYGNPLVFKKLFKKGYTWPLRVNKVEADKIKKANPFVHSSQFQQDPQLIEGNFIKGKWLRYYKELPDPRHFHRLVMTVDTALEGKRNNDRTVWMVWGLARDGRAYLIDYKGARLEVPDIEIQLDNVYKRFRNSAETKLPRLGIIYVEKKASGHGIIQRGERHGWNVEAVERNTDKVSRAMASVPALKTGALMLPGKRIKTAYTDNSQWQLMIDEIMSFSADMSHINDDFCDNIFDAADIFYNKAAGFREAFNDN